MISTETIQYQVEDKLYEGFIAYDSTRASPQPAILIAHAWKGQDPFVRQKAEALAKLGFVGFAADVYGKGIKAETNEKAAELMMPLYLDRAELQKRVNGALNILKKHECVDKSRLGAMGYCFGGLTVLELLRSGANIRGAVSFHAVLSDQMQENVAKRPPNAEKINGSILFLHGHADPMMSQEDIDGILNELSKASVDWQFHQYSNTMHAFTNPDANDVELGTVYNSIADKRAWTSMQNFFNEVFL